MKALLCAAMPGMLAPPRRVRAQNWLSNIVFIVMDTTRADHMSFLGYGRDTTPNLHALAAKSSLFTRAIAPSNWTLPSFASMLCGKYPINHTFNSPMDANTLSGGLANTLGNLAYRTVSVQTNGHLRRLDGDFQERFNLQDEDPVFIDAIARRQAVDWLAGGGGNNLFFMFLGLFGAHQKYYPKQAFPGYLGDGIFSAGAPISVDDSPTKIPGENLLRFEDIPSKAQPLLGHPRGSDYYRDARIYTASYDSEINFTDQQIGLVMDELKRQGLFDPSLIVVTADHGEMMDSGLMFFDHGLDFTIGQIHVPLMIKLPFQGQGQVLSQWVSVMDIAPTILEYLGLDLQGQEGASLLSLLNGSVPNWTRPEAITAYSEVFHLKEDGSSRRARRLLALLADGYKFVKTIPDGSSSDPSYNLHYLETDPQENQDLAATRPDLLARFQEYAAARYPNF